MLLPSARFREILVVFLLIASLCLSHVASFNDSASCKDVSGCSQAYDDAVISQENNSRSVTEEQQLPHVVQFPQDKAKAFKPSKSFYSKGKQVKAPVPREIANEVTAKALKYVFWDGRITRNYLADLKLIGPKKSECLINEFKRVPQSSKTIAVPPRNLCATKLYDASREGQWIAWNIEGIQEGSYRFSDKGTTCEQIVHWKISASTSHNGHDESAYETGRLIVRNSTRGFTLTCEVEGVSTIDEKAEWRTQVKHSMELLDFQRSETLNRTQSMTIGGGNGGGAASSRVSKEFINDWIKVALNQMSVPANSTILGGELFVQRASREEFKLYSGQVVNEETVNGEKAKTERTWRKVKESTDVVDSYSKGITHGVETSKVKRDVTKMSSPPSDEVWLETGVTSERFRRYQRYAVGEKTPYLDFTDVGDDRKWKTNTQRPDKSSNQPIKWQIANTITLSHLEPFKKDTKKNTNHSDL